MAIYGVAQTISYIAWDTAANAGKTGDAANHTLRWIKDGTAAAPTNSPVEVDATNAPGVYNLQLTAAEASCWQGLLAGKSSTASVVIMPVAVAFERLPTAAPGSSGGLPVLDASGYVAADVQTVATDAIGADQVAESAVSEIVTGVWGATTRTLTGLGDLGTAIASAVWDALTSGMVTGGSIGKKLADWIPLTETAILDADASGGTPGTASIRGAISRLPASAPGAEGGLPVLDASGNLSASVTDITAAALDSIYDEEIGSAGATDNTARAALKAAWAQGFGRWAIVGTTLNLYGPDGVTVVRQFTLDDASAPTSRTPL